jgi:hypothetical protein
VTDEAKMHGDPKREAQREQNCLPAPNMIGTSASFAVHDSLNDPQGPEVMRVTEAVRRLLQKFFSPVPALVRGVRADYRLLP